MLGFQSKFYPSFVKAYANLEETILDAFRTYGREVKDNIFPE